MIIHDFTDRNSLLNQFVAELRDSNIQRDRMRFRKNLVRIGEILAYELSKTLMYEKVKIKTPLGVSTTSLLNSKPVICSILRAALPLHNGILNYFDAADSAFISAFRKHSQKDSSFEIVVEYMAIPDINDKILIISDPMLATGQSLLNVYDALKEQGSPKEIHVVSVIGAREGIENIRKNLPENTKMWIAEVDETLDERKYIIPGLGDAGDLAFGGKL